MDKIRDPLINLGSSLKQIRSERGLSLDECSKLTGVSKSMLGQIERGESNPTISVLWKISTGLKVAFSDLLRSNKPSTKVNNILELDPVEEAEGKMKLYDVFPFDPLRGFEYFYISMEPGAKSYSQAHKANAEEYIVVTRGCLTMEIGGERKQLKAPSAIRFRADIDHVYINEGDESLVFQNIISY